jgi:ankyrin repeat protein
MKTKVDRVWVTSSPVQKEALETQLSVISFRMKTLSRESQEEMLLKLWMSEAGEKKVTCELHTFIKNILFKLNKSASDFTFTGCPLYITMIATVYEKHMEEHLNSGDWFQPNIKLLNLYKAFVKRKLRIYLKDKQNAEITNSSVLDNFKVTKQILFNKFEKCALVATLPPTVLESLHDKKIEEEIQPFLEAVQAGEDKTGIVMNVMDGKPQFVHRKFAEFFTARWFSRNFKDNRSVLERTLFDPEYSFVRYMFDRMLAKHFPLHSAAIEGDRQSFETQLQQGCDVTAVDMGGRTVTHIIAQNHELRTVDPEFYIEVSLDIRDSVMQQTPLQYAIQSKNWYMVERLLERDVDRSGLDMIRKRAEDPDYIDPIVMESAELGLVLLLEFLCSIGVNILQASSVRSSSPVHAAVFGRKLQAIRWLIQHGADCNTVDSDGQTPLLLAVTEGLPDVVRVLVEEGGASVEVCDNDGRTAIDLAKRNLSYPRNYRNSNDYDRSCKIIVRYLEDRVHKKSICGHVRSDTSICIIV